MNVITNQGRFRPPFKNREMREIKYRGIKTDNKAMVYGDLMTAYIHHSGKMTIIEFGITYHKVEPETVGQYTGLKDKNGKDIYEGDIVKIKGRKKIGEYITSVIYSRQGFKIKQNNTYVNDYYCLTLCEVIGNIHENPDLIK